MFLISVSDEKWLGPFLFPERAQQGAWEALPQPFTIINDHAMKKT
jgi:hypothetical protein